MKWQFKENDIARFKTVDTDLASRSGSVCIIVRRLTDDEAYFNETGPMYAIRFPDGTGACAFEDELTMTLSKRYQTREETINLLKWYADNYKYNAEDTDDSEKRIEYQAKAEAFRIAAFEIEHNME